MVVVVPALAVGQNRKQPVVATVFARFVIAVAPHVSGAVDRPSHVPSINRSHDHSPEQALCRTLNHSGEVTFKDGSVEKTANRERYHVGKVNQNPVLSLLQPHIVTVPHQVAAIFIKCRRCTQFSVVDKQPTHVRPKSADVGRVRIWLVVGVLVMNAMH